MNASEIALGISGFEKEKKTYLEKIEELKNIPEDIVFISSDPTETTESLIADLENRIKLCDLGIEKLKLLLSY